MFQQPEMPVVTPEAFEVMKNTYVQRTDEELDRMLRHIQPLVRVFDKVYPMKQPFDLRRFTYAWAADCEQPPLENLHRLCDITTLHPPRGGFFGIFKPTVGDVLDAIAMTRLRNVRAFELFGPKTNEDFRRQYRPFAEGFQVGIAVLYG